MSKRNLHRHLFYMGGGNSLIVYGRKLHVRVGICSNVSGESSLNTCKKFLRNFKPVRLLIDLYI